MISDATSRFSASDKWLNEFSISSVAILITNVPSVPIFPQVRWWVQQFTCEGLTLDITGRGQRHWKNHVNSAARAPVHVVVRPSGPNMLYSCYLEHINPDGFSYE